MYPSLSLSLSPSVRKGRSWVVERVVSPATLTAQERDELVEQLSKLQISGEYSSHTYTHTLTHNTPIHVHIHIVIVFLEFLGYFTAIFGMSFVPTIPSWSQCCALTII